MFPYVLCNSASRRLVHCVSGPAGSDCCEQARFQNMFCTGSSFVNITDTERVLVNSRTGGTQCQQNGGGGGSPVNCNYNARIPDLFAGRDYMYVSLGTLAFVCMRSKAWLSVR